MTGSGTVVDPTARDKYLLEVTAGPSYDTSTHNQVSVNGSSATKVESDVVTAWIRVRIKNYHGLPHGSPTSSAYFDHPLHPSDRYSIAFSFVPKRDVSGKDAVMGFDYDHSIKHQLPPGFKTAVKIATSMLDPGLYSDPYSDEPYLYGPALSSFFALRIGEVTEKVSAEDQLTALEKEADSVIEEGAEGSGKEARERLGLPPKWKKRRKYFLDAVALGKFTFERGRMYHADFFNPHLDFANFALRLPGFSISVAKYIDEKTHHLRFVLKDRSAEQPFFVVFFKLLFGKELDAKLENEKNLDESNTANTSVDGHRTVAAGHRNVATKEDTEIQRLNVELSKSPATVAKEESESMTSNATAAATQLAKSIHAVYAALGFGSPSPSDPMSSSRSSSPQASSQSLEAQIDDMDDSMVEKYLQSRHGSLR